MGQYGGDIPEGKAYVSTSGSLPCKKVIHVVSPVWKDGRSKEDNILYDALYESLLTAEKHSLSSVALPVLSFGFPTATSTNKIVDAVKDFLEAQTQSCVKKVYLLDRRDDVARAFHTGLVRAFGSEMVVQDESKQKGKCFCAPFFEPVILLIGENTCSCKPVVGCNKVHLLRYITEVVYFEIYLWSGTFTYVFFSGVLLLK